MSIDIHQNVFWDNRIEETFNEWVKTIPIEQYEAVYMYMYHEHKNINVGLLEDTPNKYAEPLNAAVNNGLTLSGTFYRGSTRLPKFDEGDIFENKMFLSTSSNPHIAANFMNRDKVFYQIDTVYGGLPVVSNMNEEEVLFGTNRFFRVENIIPDTNVNIFYPNTDYSVTHDNITFVHLIEQV